jgi:hypothetical protein
MYSEIIPKIRKRIPNKRRIKETIVPKPGKGTP